VLPRANDTAAIADGRLTLRVPPVSWNVVRLEP
jgi:alpha-N-arabinofuranosidase